MAKARPKPPSRLPIDRAKSAIDGVRFRADEIDRKWGRGRLRLLVDAELREKFDRQQRKFEFACQDFDVEEIEILAKGMLRGFDALEDAAASAGKLGVCTATWEFEIRYGDGTTGVGVLIKDERDVAKVDQLGRDVVVVTLEEVGNLISNHDYFKNMRKVAVMDGEKLKPLQLPFEEDDLGLVGG